MKALKAGKILLAEPFMLDPNFKRAAVLLCDHGEDGSIGFVINRPLNHRINTILEDFPEFEAEVYFGGPVDAETTLHYVHNVGDLLEGSVKIASGVYWGGDFDKLKILIASELIRPHNIRFFLGYAGWGEGQLAEEMSTGSWVIADADANYLFKMDPTQLWQAIMENKGNTYTVIAQMPDSANWN
jgi:putative transcriptional regulator